MPLTQTRRSVTREDRVARRNGRTEVMPPTEKSNNVPVILCRLGSGCVLFESPRAVQGFCHSRSFQDLGGNAGRAGVELRLRVEIAGVVVDPSGRSGTCWAGRDDFVAIPWAAFCKARKISG